MDDPVLKMVEREIAKNPDISSSELHIKVGKKHPAVQDLSIRQFHARYPLRVKRALAGAKKKRGGAAKRTTRKTARPARRKTRRTTRRAAVNTGGGRSGNRDVLLRFAEELVGKSDLSFKDVLARVDHYAEKLG